ncbi:unnamed protein product [Malus baccata var. baccata]
MESLILKNKNYGLLLLQTDDCTSIAQHFVSKDGVSNFRGRVLRGESAINGGVFSRASEDYVEKVGWNKMVLDAYKWVEYRNAFKPKLTSWLYVAELSFLEAGIFPYNGFSLDHIGGTKIGITKLDERGTRNTSVDFLAAGNPNCCALARSLVQKRDSDYNLTKLHTAGQNKIQEIKTPRNLRRSAKTCLCPRRDIALHYE